MAQRSSPATPSGTEVLLYRSLPPQATTNRASLFGSLMTQLRDARAEWTETLLGPCYPPRLWTVQDQPLSIDKAFVQDEEGVPTPAL